MSCNGLLLCSSSGTGESGRNYYIYNPTTQQFSTLPKFNVRTVIQRTNYDGVNLAFDPSKSPHYKVVCVRTTGRNTDHNQSDSYPHLYQIEIYSSETRSWKLSTLSFTALVNTSFGNGVYWNGAIHWINSWGDFLYFNLDEERIGTIPMPPVPIPFGYKERRRVHFGESYDHVHLIEINGPPTILFDVYELKRDYSGWFVKYHVDLNPIATAFPEMIRRSYVPYELDYYSFLILSIVRREKDEDSFLVLHIRGKALRYNLVDKSFYKLCDFAPTESGVEFDGYLKFRWWYCSAFHCIESLSCV